MHNGWVISWIDGSDMKNCLLIFAEAHADGWCYTLYRRGARPVVTSLFSSFYFSPPTSHTSQLQGQNGWLSMLLKALMHLSYTIIIAVLFASSSLMMLCMGAFYTQVFPSGVYFS